MNRPKMIIFDYGQTLVNEHSFNPLEGTKAIIREVANNPNNVTPEDIQTMAREMDKDIRRHGERSEKDITLEVHNHIFQNYLYEYFDIELTKSQREVERIFANSSLSMEPTEGIADFLKYLKNKGIRISVISNITFSGDMLKEIIDKQIPSHNFEFIMTSSEYVFRKPHRRIFELALRKAKLDPSEVWYCGDNGVCDVDGASNCGIYPVWYKGAIGKGNHIKEPSIEEDYLEINHWNELIDLLEKLK